MPIGDLLEFLVARGFWFPVLPGHPKITIGGCIGFNVHGKSQFHDGLFGEQVLKLELFHPAHGELQLSPNLNRPLFDLTLGGMGLTGFITRVTLKIQPLQGQSLQRRRLECSSLLEAAQIMQELKASCSQIYSWNDLNLRGAQFGAGFVYLEDFDPEPRLQEFRPRDIHPSAPLRGIARWIAGTGTRFINPTYRLLERTRPAIQKFPLLQGAFPLNGKEIYFTVCASSGFQECQAIIPFSSWPNFAPQLEDLLARFEILSSLGSLKIFRGVPKLLNFSEDGICLALDVPAQALSQPFFENLDQLLIASRALPNLSKDSRLSAQVVAQTYPEYSLFKQRIREFDPQGLIRSQTRSRIDV